jgi:hypothetical protein
VKIFRGQRPMFAAWRGDFIHDMLLHVHRFSDIKADLVRPWIEGLP